jgi:hypothetical protein
VQLAARVHELEASVLQKSQADEAVQAIGGLLDKQKQQFESFLQKTEQGKKREVREKQEQVDALHEKLHDVEEGLQASKDALISAHVESQILARKVQEMCGHHSNCVLAYCRCLSRHIRCVSFLSFFSDWKSLCTRRQAVRTCLSLAGHGRRESKLLIRIITLWRERLEVRANVGSILLVCSAAMVARRERKHARLVMALWRRQCDIFARVIFETLRLSSAIQHRFLQRIFISLHTAIGVSAVARYNRLGMGQYIAAKSARRCLAAAMSALTLILHRCGNRAKVENVLLPIVARDESARALLVWKICHGRSRHVSRVLDNISSRQNLRCTCEVMLHLSWHVFFSRRRRKRRLVHIERYNRKLLLLGWEALKSAWLIGEHVAIHQRTTAVVLRSLRSEICRQRKQKGMDALLLHMHSMRHIKIILQLTCPHPLLLDTAVCVHRGKIPNHAYKVISHYFVTWEQCKNTQAALKEVTRRVLVSKRKNDLEIDSAFTTLVNSLRRQLKLTRAFSLWKNTSSRSIAARALPQSTAESVMSTAERVLHRKEHRAALLLDDIRRIARAIVDLANSTGADFLSILDSYHLEKCCNVEELLRELDVARNVARARVREHANAQQIVRDSPKVFFMQRARGAFTKTRKSDSIPLAVVFSISPDAILLMIWLPTLLLLLSLTEGCVTTERLEQEPSERYVPTETTRLHRSATVVAPCMSRRAEQDAETHTCNVPLFPANQVSTLCGKVEIRGGSVFGEQSQSCDRFSCDFMRIFIKRFEFSFSCIWPRGKSWCTLRNILDMLISEHF